MGFEIPGVAAESAGKARDNVLVWRANAEEATARPDDLKSTQKDISILDDEIGELSDRITALEVQNAQGIEAAKAKNLPESSIQRTSALIADEIKQLRAKQGVLERERSGLSAQLPTRTIH